MIQAILKFLLFEIPIFIFSGLKFIIFDGYITDGSRIYIYKRRRLALIRKQILQKYLERCAKEIKDE